MDNKQISVYTANRDTLDVLLSPALRMQKRLK